MTKRKKKLCWATADRCKLAFNIWKILFKNFFFFLLLLTSLYLPFKFIGHNQYGVLQPYSENIKIYNSSGDKRSFLQKNNQKKKKSNQTKSNQTEPNQTKSKLATEQHFFNYFPQMIETDCNISLPFTWKLFNSSSAK